MKDTRPVICYICRRKMYYSEHPKHEKELKLTDNFGGFIAYIHAKCIRALKSSQKTRKAK